MIYRVRRLHAIEQAMGEAARGNGPGALSEALEKYAGDPDIHEVVESARSNGYPICMCAAGTGDVALFKRVCQMGGKPFDMDEPSGDTPFSVTVYYMNRKRPAYNEDLFRYLLDIGAMQQPSTYHLYNLVGSIWKAGIVGGKSVDFLQAAIDAGMDMMRLPGENIETPRDACPMEELCRDIDEQTVDCLAWLFQSGNVRVGDTLDFLGAADRNLANIGKRIVNPAVATRLRDIVGAAMAGEAKTSLEEGTVAVQGKTPTSPRL